MHDKTGLGPVSFETSSSRVVSGIDIAKVECRLATAEERWRFGVEQRRIGSRWYPQKPAPHYAAPEPYVYRKQPQPLAWRNSDKDLARINDAYAAWLVERDKPQPKPAKRAALPSAPAPSNVVPLVRVTTPTPAREADRRQSAAELLRDIAGGYGPRRAHKLRAMADWLTAATATPITASAED